jgi:hypothetical protein
MGILFSKKIKSNEMNPISGFKLEEKTKLVRNDPTQRVIHIGSNLYAQINELKTENGLDTVIVYYYIMIITADNAHNLTRYNCSFSTSTFKIDSAPTQFKFKTNEDASISIEAYDSNGACVSKLNKALKDFERDERGIFTMMSKDKRPALLLAPTQAKESCDDFPNSGGIYFPQEIEIFYGNRYTFILENNQVTYTRTESTEKGCPVSFGLCNISRIKIYQITDSIVIIFITTLDENVYLSGYSTLRTTPIFTTIQLTNITLIQFRLLESRPQQPRIFQRIEFLENNKFNVFFENGLKWLYQINQNGEISRIQSF